jgi:hypothetical protein
MAQLCESSGRAASVMIGNVRTRAAAIRRGVCGSVRVCADMSVC